MISIIAALAKNGVIGVGNDLPWRLPSDLQWFKKVTLGHTIIMGRNTWDSLPFKPLPKRTNIVVSTTMAPQDGITVCRSLEEAIEASTTAETWIIGGATLYEAALSMADRLVLSEIATDVEGDTFFPEFNKGTWFEDSRTAMREDNLPYDIVIYHKK